MTRDAAGVSLSFLGAAGCVTGSRFLLETGKTRILVDCGLYQEREHANRNWDPFPVPPHTIDHVVLTHAHLDHSGYLPKLAQLGYRGPVWCTPATAEIATVLLRDAARIQKEDANYKRKRHRREGRRGPYPEVPLYSLADVTRATSLFRRARYHETMSLGHGVHAEFRDAGHVLGAASVAIDVRLPDRSVRILFSGDVGRWDRPLIRDPEPWAAADYVVVESTYGDRQHADGDLEARLADVINETVERGGNIVIPAFALERAQELLFHLKRLTAAKRIPPLLAFLDSPMATTITNIFRAHPDMLDPEVAAQYRNHGSPFEYPGLKFVRTIGESRAINSIRGSAIIIAGAGMCNGGRIKHHLVQNIGRAESTILFVGYQARGTLGRRIVTGENPVRILGEERDVRARVVDLEGFSAHADLDELLRWLGGIEGKPARTFVVHGEPGPAEAMASAVTARLGWPAVVPQYGDTFEL